LDREEKYIKVCKHIFGYMDKTNSNEGCLLIFDFRQKIRKNG